MNILLINHYAGGPPFGMEFRPYYLSREWVRTGHRVMLLAASYSHVRATQPEVVKKPLNESIDGITYRWYPTPMYRGNGTGRVRNMLHFLGWLFRDGKNIARGFNPDVVIASSTYPMDIWPAQRIAKMAGSKLVFEVHDLWPLSPIELGGFSRWHPFIQWVQAAEDTAFRRANAVISMLPKVQDYMVSRRMDPEKLYIIPNGIDTEEWQSNTSSEETDSLQLICYLKAKGLIIIGYAGSHGIANALSILLDSAALMSDEPVAFVLVGSGLEKSKLQKQAQVQNLRNVWFFDPVRKDQIPSLLALFDIAYLGWLKQPLYRFGISPNKLMDYMMAGRPVLHSVDAGNDLVSESGCGVTVRPEDPKAVMQGIRSLLALSEDERNFMGRMGKQYVLEHHDYKVLARRFIAALTG